MLSTVSGFTPDQVQRYRTMSHMMLAGIIILTLGVGILCFGRMYTFDASRYDLFTVFGVIIVIIAVVTIVVPVGFQLKIYLEVRKAKDEGTSGSEYAAPRYVPATMAMPAGYRPGTLPQVGGGTVYHQSQYQHQQHMPFSSATYMMGQQQQQQHSMMQRMDPQQKQYNESFAGEETPDTLRQQGRGPMWSSAGKQQMQQQPQY